MRIGAATPDAEKLSSDSDTTLQAAAAVTTGVAGPGQTAIAGISEAEYQKYIESKKEKSEPKSEPKNMFEVIQREIAKQEAEDQGGSSSVQVPAKYSNEPRHDTITTPDGGIAPAKSLENIIQVETTVKTTTGENINIVAPLSKFNQNVKDAIITPEFVENYNNAQIQAARQKEPVPLDQTYNPYSHGTTREIPVSERPGVQESVFKIYDETGKKVTIPKTAEQIYQEEQYSTSLERMGIGIIDLKGIDTFVNTYVKDPVGRFNPVDPNPLSNKLFGTDSPSERIEQFNKYDDSGDDRAITSATVPVNLALTFLPSFGVGVAGGAAVRGAGFVIGKLGSSGKIGSTVANIITKPLITSAGTKTVVRALDVTAEKKASSNLIRLGADFAATHPTITAGLSATSKAVTTPTNAALNTIAVSYGIDVASRISEAPTTEQKIGTAFKIAATEIPGLVIGGKLGYTTATKAIGRYETRGLVPLKTTEYGYETGIPIVKNPTFSALKESFAKGTYTIKPYYYSNTANPYIRQPHPTDARLPDNPAVTIPGQTQYKHTTQFGDSFNKPTVTVQPGSSEAPGLYLASVFNFYYAKTGSYVPKSSPIMTGKLQTSNPAAVNIYGDTPIAIPYQRVGLPQNAKGARLYMSKDAKTGEVYLLNIKGEMEGVLTAGTQMKQLPSRYYFDLNGVRVPVREYEIMSTSEAVKPPIKTSETRPTFRSGSSGRQNAQYQYPSINSPVSSLRISSGSNSAKASSPGYSPGSYSPGSPSYGSSPGTSKARSSPGYSPGSYSPGLPSYGSSPGTSLGASLPRPYVGKSPMITPTYNPPKYTITTPPVTPPKKKRDDEYNNLNTRYKPLRREVLHHLSIIDPAEAINAGSFTGSRKRPERIINTKDILYEFSGTLRTKKPRKTK